MLVQPLEPPCIERVNHSLRERDYGARIKARSKAVQTFVVQLAGQASYLPTKRSIAGGAYGAIPESTLVGPEGGQMLVDATVALIDSLWSDVEKKAGTP